MKKSTQSSIEKEFSVIRLCVGFLIKFILWAVVGGLIALIISCLLLALFGEAQAFRYINDLIVGQYHALAHSMFKAVMTFPLQFSLLFNTIHPLNFWGDNFNIQIAHWLPTGVKANAAISATNPFLWHVQILFSAYGNILLLTLQLMLVRLVILVCILPLFILFGMIGIVEGLVARDIRRFSGGRESALLYHRAKKYIPVTFLVSIFLYLILPLNINPQWLFVPGACLFSLAIAITLRSFKKYV